ncbi:MAG: hypothetical protein ACFE0O_09215 [Opitutales bacterium]
MNQSTPLPGSRTIGLSLVLVTMLATGAHLMWYGQTAMGQQPVLDGRETVTLAEQIANGTLPDEPFYRAPGYAALLALGLKAGLLPEQLPALARFLNLAAQVGSVLLIWGMARRLRPARAPGWTAWLPAALYGLYPVAHHFAGDPLDITVAITAWLGAIYTLLRFHQADGSAAACRWAAGAGLLIGVGCLIRPHLLPVLLVLPFAALWLRDSGRQRVLGAALIGGTAAVCLSGFGWVNLEVGGQFRVTPWQGSFNLFAANRPGADGRFFTQSLEVGNRTEYRNPARIESEVLYRQAHPDLSDQAIPIEDLNAWYRDRLHTAVREDPGAWLRLLGFKAYALLNIREAYNNKTYAFHKGRSPALRWSPLNWSWVLLIGVPGLWILRRDPFMQVVVVLAAAYTAGLLLTYASARFRLPLVPLLLTASTGTGALAARWSAFGRRERWAAAALGGILGLLSVTALFGIEQPDTTVEDRLLLSRAASDVGRDAEAARWAAAVLDRQPTRHAAAELYLVSRFNQLLLALPALPAAEQLERDLARVRPAGFQSARQQQILGVYRWLLGDRRAAVALWRRLIDRKADNRDSALAALALAGELRPGDRALMRRRLSAEPDTILLMAALAAGFEAWLPPTVDPENPRWQEPAAQLRLLFRSGATR